MAPRRVNNYAALILLVSINSAACLENGLARTPPMGWLAWERYVCELDCALYPDECINSQLFAEMATRLVSDGFRELGYNYVNIDDCWSTRERDSLTERLVADPNRFPSASIKPLADFVHSKGLKLGLYGDCGTRTCQNFPGQLKYENKLEGNYFELDAKTFADWQIDSFKFDGCYLNASRASELCPSMEFALNKTGRPMLFSCSWPAYENDLNLTTNWPLVVERCNLWRAFGDIEDSYRSVLDTIDWFVRKQELVVRFHGPGGWFDADQLVIGNFGLSFEQEQAHMAIWCIWATPLYMSNDLRSLTRDSSRILKNKWAIQVNQDKMGVFGLMVFEERQIQVFAKPVEPFGADGVCPSYAIVYLNRRTLGGGRVAGFKLAAVIGQLHAKLASARPDKWAKWAHCSESGSSSSSFAVHDIFQDFSKVADLSVRDELKLNVNPSGVAFVKLIRR